MQHTPKLVRLSNPFIRWQLRLGIPMGGAALLTVPGRKSGLPRTTPVMLVEIDGRRWIFGTYGNVNWVRNLRISGEGVIRLGRRRPQRFSASELSREEATAFFSDTLPRFVAGHSPLQRSFSKPLLRKVLRDPEEGARSHPVFEVQRSSPSLLDP